MNNVLKKVILGVALCGCFGTVGGTVLPSLKPIEAKAYSKYVKMQSIYHENNNTVTVLFKADESDRGSFDLNTAYIHVKNEDTGVVTRYQAQRQSTDEKGESLYKATFNHAEGEHIKIEIEFVTVSNTGHQQSLFDNNGGHWYQCHSWN